MDKVMTVHVRLDKKDYKNLQSIADEKRLPVSTFMRMKIMADIETELNCKIQAKTTKTEEYTHSNKMRIR